MSIIEILIVGTNQPIMETIKRLINKEGAWEATIALSGKEALALCHKKDFRLVLLCAGLEEELLLKEKLLQLKPNVPVVKHYGGGSGLLFAEIHQAFASI
ncbi:MAG: response regulator [Chitinophagaceae bacterium]|nr:MAG: response regulator [Chitinophagaceae bacterium]